MLSKVVSSTIFKVFWYDSTWDWTQVSRAMYVHISMCLVSVHVVHPWKNCISNCTRMLWAILNKSWKQHPTKQRYGHLPLISKTIQIRRTRHAGHCWRSKDELISDVLQCTPSYGCEQVMDVRLELIYNSSVQTQDVV